MTNNAYRMGPPPPQPEEKDSKSPAEVLATFIGALVLLAVQAAWYVAIGVGAALILAQVTVTGLGYVHVHAGLAGPTLLVIAAEGVIAAGVTSGVRSAESLRAGRTRRPRRRPPGASA